MLASSAPLGEVGLLVTLRSEKGEYIEKLPSEDWISRQMGVQVKKRKEYRKEIMWDGRVYIGKDGPLEPRYYGRKYSRVTKG